MTNFDERLGHLERRLRSARRQVMALAAVVAMTFCAAAATSRFADLVCATLQIKTEQGETVTALRQNGDVEVGGRLTAQGVVVVNEISRLHNDIDNLKDDFANSKRSLHNDIETLKDDFANSKKGKFVKLGDFPNYSEVNINTADPQRFDLPAGIPVDANQICVVVHYAYGGSRADPKAVYARFFTKSSTNEESSIPFMQSVQNLNHVHESVVVMWLPYPPDRKLGFQLRESVGVPLGGSCGMSYAITGYK